MFAEPFTHAGGKRELFPNLRSPQVPQPRKEAHAQGSARDARRVHRAGPKPPLLAGPGQHTFRPSSCFTAHLELPLTHMPSQPSQLGGNGISMG